MKTLATVHRAVIRCETCARLRAHCQRVAQEKKAAYRNETYWARPVPGFGDPRARLLLLGLAPAAHGANRTGRMFTGDGSGGSGDFLMRAMYAAGFVNKPTSERANDGLVLSDAYVLAAVRCAPPDNKPTRDEILHCHRHLEAEIGVLQNLQVVVALGRLASEAYWRLLAGWGVQVRPRPPFAHGDIRRPEQSDLPILVESYHPSRQNTQTGKLTPSMLDDVFRTARNLLW
ncbi:MAG: uracil-DNA glycosylase [Luteitalea sp.]|nr:uracil-DNA glycosylase [Luteitalea sp.]